MRSANRQTCDMTKLLLTTCFSRGSNSPCREVRSDLSEARRMPSLEETEGRSVNACIVQAVEFDSRDRTLTVILCCRAAERAPWLRYSASFIKHKVSKSLKVWLTFLRTVTLVTLPHRSLRHTAE